MARTVDLSDLYLRASNAGGDAVDRKLLYQRHWINSVTKFDPRTGEALTSGISSVLENIDCMERSDEFRDHLWFIVNHCEDSIHRIFESMSESPSRRHEYMHVSKVRELDVSSFVALSRRPGRNVREKLSSKPVMKAVRRVQSIDLPQNQLVKEFVLQLVDFLESRIHYLKSRALNVQRDEDFLDSARRWLRSDEANSISPWRNLPPNNALLSHPDYRRVWNSWNWLSSLESILGNCAENVESYQSVIDFWQQLAVDHQAGSLTIAEVPVTIGIETFEIQSFIDWSDVKFGTPSGSGRVFTEPVVIDSPVCIDLSTTFPRFAVDETDVRRLSEPLIWQNWRKNEITIDLELFDADAGHLHEFAETYSVVDLLFKRRPNEATISRAARSFAEHLRSKFRDPTLLWLVPDSVDEFRLGILRRSLNSRFQKALPLPRSVAAVFSFLSYESISKEGFAVFVVDRAAGSTFVTKLVAQHDPELEEQVPETKGFYWERTPHVEIHNQGNTYDQISEFDFVDRSGEWVRPIEVLEGPTADESLIFKTFGIDQNDPHKAIIELIDTPVNGGIRFLRLQELAGDIPLWRDQIPTLAIKVMSSSGLASPLVLVPKDHPVRLVRGKPVRIPVVTEFELPKGQLNYRFAILQGSSEKELDFEAFLESDDFPRDQVVEVSLDLTYTYGADDPYKLIFRPVKVDSSEQAAMRPVVARWAAKKPIDINSLPKPELPEKKSWVELKSWEDDRPDSGGARSDLLEWTKECLGKMWGVSKPMSRIAFDSVGAKRVFDRRVFGQIASWPEGRDFFFVKSESHSNNVYCHVSEIIGTKTDFRRKSGGGVWLRVDQGEIGPKGSFISADDSLEAFQQYLRGCFTEQKLVSYVKVEKALNTVRFPTYNIWNLGRSVRESDCPDDFREMIVRAIDVTTKLFNDAGVPTTVKNEALLFLSRLHEDSPVEIQKFVADLSMRESQNFNDDEAKAIAYFIGSCSTKWQELALEKILSGDSHQKVSILSKVLTRSPIPATFVTLEHLKLIVPVTHNQISKLLEDCKSSRSRKSLVDHFELLLGLLLTRASDAPGISAYLSPDSEYGSKFVTQIEQAIKTYVDVDNDYEFKTRVSLEVTKPPIASEQPDLLYALRLYLTGDDQANLVRISGISEG